MKVRLIVAAVGIPLLLLILLLLPTVVTSVVCGLVAALAAFELLKGTGLVKNIRLVIYTAVMAFMSVLWCHYGMESSAAVVTLFLFVGVLFAELLISRGKLPVGQIALCAFGGIVLPLLLASLVRIHNLGYGRFYVLLPFVIAFTADAGAYFAGRFFGRHKLAPVISPNKTVEGAVGGIVGCVAGMLIYCVILDLGFNFSVNYIYAVSYGIVGALVAIFGDLSFSAIKRQTGIKDYGNLLPGHGGILDRFDSMLLVAPLVEIFLTFLPVVMK